jgi:hypothetical protein
LCLCQLVFQGVVLCLPTIYFTLIE